MDMLLMGKMDERLVGREERTGEPGIGEDCAGSWRNVVQRRRRSVLTILDGRAAKDGLNRKWSSWKETRNSIQKKEGNDERMLWLKKSFGMKCWCMFFYFHYLHEIEPCEIHDKA
jgi:hypothetical protein